MKTNKIITLQRNLKGFTLVELLVVIAIIASLAGLSYGPIMRHLDSSARTEAISNGKQIYTALTGYMAANEGAFPNEAKLTAAGGTDGTSDVYFALLFNAGSIDDDKSFNHKHGVKAGLCTEENNNNKEIDPEENCWGYVEGLLASDTSAPLIFDSSKDGVTFLTNVWKGKGIIIRADGGAKAMDITFTPPLNPTDLAQNGTINYDLDGTPTDMMGTDNLAGGNIKANQ